MAVSSDFADFVKDQLAPVSMLASGRFFGGIGLADGVQFAMVMDHALRRSRSEFRPQFICANEGGSDGIRNGAGASTTAIATLLFISGLLVATTVPLLKFMWSASHGSVRIDERDLQIAS